MKIYIDDDFKCHVAPADGLREVETNAFNGKSNLFIEGCRFIPSGEAWTREDGEVFWGECYFPWEDSTLLEAAQAAYEDVLNGADLAYREGVNCI